ncbi:MAG: hypothetical protein ACD_12C00312G0019 [uncultured bacterium]|nr:MAG: hypothetical protein ACD_12C00312G0019 [uncultured bacterium]
MTKKLWFVLVASVFIFINIFFNFNLWKELFDNKVTVSDNIVTEYLVETGYQNILHFKNPFITKTILYPFTINFSMNDSNTAFVLPFMLLRPFLNPHRSILIITFTGFFLSNIFMYLLLRKFKINKVLSVLVGLIFGFMPFLSHRIQGHYTYVSTYFFPLIFLLVLDLIRSNNLKKKILLSIGLSISLALVILTNLYYFFIVMFGILFYALFYFFRNKNLLIKIIVINLKYLLITLFVFLIILLPWIIQVFQFMYFDGFEKQAGFAGSPILSADLLSFFTPSEYNPIYKKIFSSLPTSMSPFVKYQRFFFTSWEKFAYPGIIILLVYFVIIFFKKKLPVGLIKKIQPHFLISLFFALLSMGPFFKVFNRWALPLGDGISFVLPLPFIILHYFPILNSLRAPMRFNPGFVFLATLTSAFVMDYFLNKIYPKKNRYVFFLIIFFVFIFDQMYVIPPPSKVLEQTPNKLYQKIQIDKVKSTVLEIPLTVRDGFQYLGFVHAVNIMNGPLIYGKPVIGGYLSRLNQGIFDYYDNLPFIGYVLKITDKGNYNPDKEKPRALNIFPYEGSLELAKQEVDFLDIKYILLKNDEEYTKSIAKLIGKLGYTKQLHDGKYDLYERKINGRNFESVNFGSTDDNLFAASGFSFREDGYRWGQGKLAKVFIKTNNINKQKLVFEALSFYQPQKVKVYINKKYIGEKGVSIEKNRYIIDIDGKLNQGINTIYFVFSKSFIPAKLWSHDQDVRDLAVKFFSLKLE